MAMGKMKFKDGTPVGNENLCLRCSWAQVMTGYRESDRLVICNKTSPDMVVPFVMLDCTGFDDKHRPNWQQMQKLAIRLPSPRVSGRTRGFSAAVEPRPATVAAEDDDEDNKGEAALAR
jgi:hypothetical protein